MVYKCFEKETSHRAVKMSYKELVEELHKPIARKFEKWKLQLSFIDNILGANLADTQLVSKFNVGFRF